MLALFDFSNKLTRVQTNISDMQQSLRVAQTDAVRMIRMAGRGGLPVGTLPNGCGGGGRATTSADRHPTSATPRTPEIVPGSDVLTIRGVFSSPIYQLDAEQCRVVHPRLPRRRRRPAPSHINDKTPTAIPQDLTAIKDAISKNRRPEALMLVSPQDAGSLGRRRARPRGLGRLEPEQHRRRLQDRRRHAHHRLL